MPIQTSQQCEVDSEQSKKQAYRFKAKHGFTLIELLVVVGIIGILTALGAVSYSAAQLRARDTQRKSDIASYQSALECYFSKNNEYPSADAQLQLQSSGCARDYPAFHDPKVPSGSSNYRYKFNPYLNSGKGNCGGGTKCFYYEIIGCLENSNDSEAITPKDSWCSQSYFVAHFLRKAP